MSALRLLLVEDVPAAFAACVRAAQRRSGGRLRLAASGGTGGRACMDALVAGGLDWAGIELFQVDERCVAGDSPDSNARSLLEALGPHRDELAGFHAMDCAAGAAAYGAQLAAAGALDLVQLGVGPDGHTASLFPRSPALDAPEEVLVTESRDPSGRNPHDRLTLTYGALGRARLCLVTVFGADKHDVLARLAAGDDLPAARLRGENTAWLVDPPAAQGLATVPVPPALLAEEPA